MDDAFWAVPTWPTNIMDTFDQTFLSWNTDYAPKGANSLFSGGPGFSSTISSAYALETPPQTVAPQVTDTTSFPMNITKTSGFPEDIDPSDVMFELSKINLDLHIRIAAIKKNKTTLDFDSIVYQKSPLSIDNITLAEFSIIVSQEFLIVLTKLLNTRPCTDQLCASPTTKVSSPKPLESQHRKDKNKFQDVSTPPLSHPSATLKSLPAPTVLIITSILIQLVSIYELILDHLTTRIERIPTEPLTPIPGLTFGGRPLATACTQCMTFSELLATLLKGIERVLGIIPISEGRKVVHNKRLDLRFAQSQAAVMDSSTMILPAAPDRFDLGIHTPVNLSRGARAALLQNNPAAVIGTIGVSPGPGRMAQTPSSPANPATTAAATEGAERVSPASNFEQGPISINESANDLARERMEE
ncbi:hypothetical protein FOZG_17282 [Fusarium oxysporum Fo47]|uniref:Uncharacterized protein n=1 Tax=Fusarium oxysporum Fo47 TaxID=660027 RepID=W9JHR7_FUSOX|nr:hypothetical protein FOZG_17282 [Fusarium oxysporum Fo47]